MEQPKTRLPFDRSEVDGSVAARFRRVVSQMPEALALCYDTVQLSFAELDKDSDRTARALAGRDPRRPVALAFGYGPEPLIQFLGVLKAGIPCIPIDPLAAPEGTDAALAQTQLILTEERFVDWCRSQAPDVPVCLVSDLKANTGSELPEPGAMDPAVIYLTSATTGLAKGVVHSQRNLCSFGWIRAQRESVLPGDRTAVLSSFAHILTGVFVLGAWLNGAAVELLDVRARGMTAMGAWAVSRNITVLQLSTAVLRQTIQIFDGLDEGWQPRQLIFGGEAIVVSDLRKIRDRLGWTCPMINMMGSAEAGPVSNWAVDMDLLAEDDIVPVGYPFDYQRIFIIDDEGNELSVGELGEIAVEGPYMALEFWQRPDLTAQRFVKSPSTTGGRRFLTGDFGRLRADGLLELHGRIDHVVKVRGNAVSIPEVETLLRGVTGVSEAAVVAARDKLGGSRLVGFVTLEPGRNVDLLKVRKALASRLPSFMVPWKIVALDQFPMTAGGKVARRALPMPSRARATWMPTYVEPVGAVETALASVWADVLELDSIGRDDDFFELGGDSLDLVAVTAAYSQTTGVDISEVDPFVFPKLKDLAAEVARQCSQNNPI